VFKTIADYSRVHRPISAFEIAISARTWTKHVGLISSARLHCTTDWSLGLWTRVWFIRHHHHHHHYFVSMIIIRK